MFSKKKLLSLLLAFLLAFSCFGIFAEEDDDLLSDIGEEQVGEVLSLDLDDADDPDDVDEDPDLVGIDEADPDIPGADDGEDAVLPEEPEDDPDEPGDTDAAIVGDVVAPVDGEDVDAAQNDPEAPADEPEGEEGEPEDEEGEPEEGEDEEVDGEEAGDEEGEEGEEGEDGEYEEVEMPLFEGEDPVFTLPAKLYVALKENHVISYAGTNLDVDNAADHLKVTSSKTKVVTAGVPGFIDFDKKTINLKGLLVDSKKYSVITVWLDGQVVASSKVYVKKASKSIALNYTSIAVTPDGEGMPLKASLPKGTTTQLTYEIVEGSDNITFENGIVKAKEGAQEWMQGDPPSAVIEFKTRNGQEGCRSIKCNVWILYQVATQEQFRATIPTRLTVGAGEYYEFSPLYLPDKVPMAQEHLNIFSSKTKFVVKDTSDPFVNSAIRAKKVGKSVVTVRAYNGLAAKCTVTVKKRPKTFTITAQNQVVTLVWDPAQPKTFRPSVSFPKKTACVVYWDCPGRYYDDAENEFKYPVFDPRTFTAIGPGLTTLYAYNDSFKILKEVTIHVVDTAPQLVITSKAGELTNPDHSIKPGDTINVYVKKKAYLKGGLLKNASEAYPGPENLLVSGLSKKHKKIIGAGASSNAITITGKKTGSAQFRVSTRDANVQPFTVNVKVLKAPKKIAPAAKTHSMSKYDTWLVMGKLLAGVSYTSSNASVAVVDGLGRVTALDKGTTKITVTYSKKVKTSCIINVDYQEPVIPDGGVITPDSDKKNIEAIQRKLIQLGLLAEDNPDVVAIEYGSDTTNAVKALQAYAKSCGFKIPDAEEGEVGQATLDAMNWYIDNGYIPGDVVPNWHLGVGETIKAGSDPAAVEVVQDLLDHHYSDFTGYIDGEYDGATALAVKAFQNQNNLHVTGEVDKATLDALRGVYDEDPTPMPTDAPFTINYENGVITGYTGTEDTVTIPAKSKVTGQDITGIAAKVFKGKTNITTITCAAPAKIQGIGASAFEGCKSLASAEFLSKTSGITTIGASAFKGTALTRVTIPGGVTEIVASTFEGCVSLESVTIPNKVTKIGASAFSGCSKLGTMTPY